MLHSVTKKEKETNKRSIISHEKTQYICGPGLTEGLLVYDFLLKYTAVSVCTKSHDYNSRACRETWGAVDKYKHTYTGAHSEKRWVGEILFKIEQSENLDGKYYTPESIINSNSGLTYNLSALTVSAYWVTNWTLEIAYAPIPSSGASWKGKSCYPQPPFADGEAALDFHKSSISIHFLEGQREERCWETHPGDVLT